MNKIKKIIQTISKLTFLYAIFKIHIKKNHFSSIHQWIKRDKPNNFTKMMEPTQSMEKTGRMFTLI